ncbi:MAG: GGDEF domain-containing protein, partial [Devosia sp.]|nr:GGDEF domain-containing protein [Devosia sp.]
MTDPLPTAALLELLDGLPVGIAVARSGVPVYANAAGLAHAALPAGAGDAATTDGRTLRVEQLTLPVAGAPLEVRLSTDVTEQRRLEDDLYRRAYFDGLTGLPNRDLMERTVAAMVEAGGLQVFALAFVDLDGFKAINDYFGHAIGDALLVKIAERLSGQLRKTDMLARVGGDEFVLLLSPVASMEGLAADIQRFLERLKSPFFIEGSEVLASASIGISLYPADGASYQTLCANADRAMYRGKGGAKGTVHFFNPAVDRAASERARTEQRLRLAIRDRRLTCAYQPKVD